MKKKWEFLFFFLLFLSSIPHSVLSTLWGILPRLTVDVHKCCLYMIHFFFLYSFQISIINKYFCNEKAKFHNEKASFSSVQSLSCVRLFETPWITARQAFLATTSSQSSLKLMSIESVMPSSHLILCHPLFLLPPIPPSIRVFSNKSTLHMRWPKYWSFSFCISPSKEHLGRISFRMDWLDLLAVQGTLKSLLQHHSSKASILWRSAFFTLQLSHPYAWPLEKP